MALTTSLGWARKLLIRTFLVFGLPTRALLNLGRNGYLPIIMKYIFEMKLFRRLASASVVAAYALSSGLCYAQQATPAPSPAVAAADGKETKEVKKVAEQPKPPEPR